MSIVNARIDLGSQAIPPHLWFLVSAFFHYLGPSMAVLLFPAIGVLGVAWFRIASAALVLAPWTQPCRTLLSAGRESCLRIVSLGACLALMNTSFYLALERLPMSLVACIEFIGTLGVALYGVRSRRNLAALMLAVLGVAMLLDLQWVSDGIGLFWACLNGALFVLYILLSHRAAEQGAANGIQQLGVAMSIAFVLLMPVGFHQAMLAFSSPWLVLAGIGVGVCSSVIPYLCDQLAMSRLPRASYALLLALLPATATVIGMLMLHQIPDARDTLGVLLVMGGVALHQPGRS